MSLSARRACRSPSSCPSCATPSKEYVIAPRDSSSMAPRCARPSLSRFFRSSSSPLPYILLPQVQIKKVPAVKIEEVELPPSVLNAEFMAALKEFLKPDQVRGSFRFPQPRRYRSVGASFSLLLIAFGYGSARSRARWMEDFSPLPFVFPPVSPRSAGVLDFPPYG